MKSLNPTIPILHIGVFRRFCAIACVCLGASPNKFTYIHFHNEYYVLYLSIAKVSLENIIFLSFAYKIF